jgi:predicted metal-dependent hydrolase
MNALTGLNPEGVKDVVEALEAILRRAADPALCDDTDKLLRDARAALAKIKPQ